MWKRSLIWGNRSFIFVPIALIESWVLFGEEKSYFSCFYRCGRGRVGRIKNYHPRQYVTVITNTWHFMSEPKLNRKGISWVWNQFEMITISECKIRANQLSKSCLLIFAYKCYVMSWSLLLSYHFSLRCWFIFA